MNGLTSLNSVLTHFGSVQKEAIPLLADTLTSTKGSLKGRIPCNLSDRATKRRRRGGVMQLRYLDNKTPFAAAPDFIG